MKRNPYLFLYIFLFPFIFLGQNQLDKKAALEDYTVLKNVLTQGHPNLYAYTSKATWDSLFTDFETQKIANVQHPNNWYKSLVKLTDPLGDGHFIVMRPQLDSIPSLFPLLLKIIDEKCYTDTDDFGIPIGSELLSVDGVPAATLIESFRKYAPSDGFNTTKKDRQVEREFGILHFYEFGPRDTYEITYKTPDHSVLTQTLESASFESIGRRFVQRNSYFSKYHNASQPSDFVKHTLGNKEPFVYFLDSLPAAVLTLNSFQLEPQKFQSQLQTIFKDLNRKKIAHLIIDIRQNEGGYPVNCINAFSYLAKEPFQQQLSSSVVTSSVPEAAHSQNLVNGFTYASFFETYYANAPKEGNEWVSTVDPNQPLMVPNQKGFQGKVQVLISGNTFSAGSSFALFCKNQGIPLIGEETGGGYALQTGGYPILYTLPNSKIKVLISLVKIRRYVKAEASEKGRGIFPDIEVPLTVAALIAGKDVVLDAALQQMAKN